MPYRIAVVAACPYPVPQGSQVLIRDSAVQLRDRGHTVSLFTYGYGFGACPAGLDVRGAASVPGARRTKAGPSIAKPIQDAMLLTTLRRALRVERFDAVYAHNYEGLAIALAAGLRPVIYHAHNAMADELPHYFARAIPSSAFGRQLDRRFPRRADAIIVPHERLSDYLRNLGCDDERIHCIPPAVSVNEIASYDYDARPAPVLYMGNLDRYQNLPMLERAMERLRRGDPSIRFVVATPEPTGIAGAEFVQTPDHESLLRILEGDVVVACPRTSWSGYPIKLLNAMAAAKPIVACHSAAYPIEHGRDGMVVPDNDDLAFANTLHALVHDAAERRRLGHSARDRARTAHNPSIIGAELETVFAEVIARTNANRRNAMV